MRTRSKAGAWILTTLLGINACATFQPKKYRHLWDLDLEQRTLFITYYPHLTPAQRKDLIAKIEEGPELLADWELPAGLHRDPKNYTLTELEIQRSPSDATALTKGRQLSFKAILHYANGKSVDVTDEVRWSATPETVKMKTNRLEYGCIQSEAVVSADFYLQKQGSLSLLFAKKVTSLQLEKSEAAPAADVSDYLPLKVTANCADGSSTDVSCQAVWDTHSRFGRFSACGSLHLETRTRDLDEKVPVSVTYGGITVQQQFTPLMYPK